jgi:hypothetical protein
VKGMNKGSALKMIGVSIGGILLLWLIYTILISTGTSYNISIGGHALRYNYEGGAYMGNGAYYGSSLTYLFIILIKILLGIFAVGLVGGLIVWVKNYLFTPEDKATFKETFTRKTTQVNSQTCSICGKKQHSDWNVCPYCGKEKETIEIKIDATQVVENI